MNQSTQLAAMAESTRRLCEQAVVDADKLGIEVHSYHQARVLDFAVQRPGTIAGGIRLAEICLGGLADVKLLPRFNAELDLPAVMVCTDSPLAACIGSQYAGWAFSNDNYFAMCSGPARINRAKEEILERYGLMGHFLPAVGIFESNTRPSEHDLLTFAEECRVSVEEVMICIARTASFPGTIQVVARSIETALHKLHELKFDLSTICAAVGTAPLPPLPSDDLVALGWTNDSILYGGCVNLWANTTDDAITSVLGDLPSCSSPDFGEPFLKTFNRYQQDFYKIDKMLFSPARVVFNNLKTGKVFTCGNTRVDILRSSFDFPID